MALLFEEEIRRNLKTLGGETTEKQVRQVHTMHGYFTNCLDWEEATEKYAKMAQKLAEPGPPREAFAKMIERCMLLEPLHPSAIKNGGMNPPFFLDLPITSVAPAANLCGAAPA
jgi:hypothetical protein